MDLGLEDKLAVITGGSVGIGLGVARAFAREGAQVLIAARDGGRAKAEAIASDFKSYSVGSTYYVDGGMLRTI